LKNSLGTFLESNPDYKKALDIVQIPERILQFRVVWEDDQGVPQVNCGYRVQVRKKQTYPFSLALELITNLH
jgi:glutamate dehydrogenase (NADP+)